MTRVDTHPLATANTAELTVPTSRLWTVNATIGYDKRVINENLSVSIPDESFTVIVGPNACGKSTLLRGLSRLLKPGSGRVVLDGQDIHSYKAKEVARKLGLLPQTSLAPDGIRVADLVARGRYPYQKLIDSGHRTMSRRSLPRWQQLASMNSQTGSSTNSPAGNDSESGSRWRWHSRPKSCCWTSRRRSLT